MTRPQGIMAPSDVSVVLDRVEEAAGVFDGLVHLSGYGESLLDRMLPLKVRLVRSRWPEARTVIYTNLAVPLGEQRLADLVDAGLDEVVVSLYAHNPEAYREMTGGGRLEIVLRNLAQLGRLRDGRGPRIDVRVKLAMDGVERELSSDPAVGRAAIERLVSRLGFATFGGWGLHNYGDARRYQPPVADRVCSILGGFRSRVLQVAWDLKVLPCCFDFDAKMALGDLRCQSLDEIFDGPVFRALADAHRANDFASYPVCAACSVR